MSVDGGWTSVTFARFGTGTDDSVRGCGARVQNLAVGRMGRQAVEYDFDELIHDRTAEDNNMLGWGGSAGVS